MENNSLDMDYWHFCFLASRYFWGYSVCDCRLKENKMIPYLPSDPDFSAKTLKLILKILVFVLVPLMILGIIPWEAEKKIEENQSLTGTEKTL
jgi:hypothetical protein